MRIVIQADGRKIASNTAGQPLTSGSRGVEAQFDLSADYAGLSVTAAFVAGEAKVDVVLTASSRCVVPWEVLETAGNMLLIGVVGKDGAGNIVIPTLWCKVGLIECGTVVSGIDPEDPTPDIAAQLLQIAQETVTRAETAETGAESAKTAAETAQAGAEAAKQAIEDLGVEAHTDPQGPSVEKTVDPDTGAVTLDFGIPAAPVYSVNGKTGEIELNLDEIPDGTDYVRTTPAQVRQIGTNADDIDAIEAKIPPQASATNQLADKDFVNSSINSSTAFFRGSFASHAALFAVPWQTTNPAAANYVTNNDYAYVADDETHNDEAWRYIYVLQPGGTDNGWKPQFKVNDSPLTAAQLAALNSGATAEIIASVANKYELPAAGIPKTDLAAGVQQSLDKADTALQPAALEPYRTAAAQNEIDAAQDEKIDAAAQATEETTVGPASIATFDAAAADMPLKSLLVNIEAVQAGSGDPSPENVRPITGWTGCEVTRTGKNLIDCSFAANSSGKTCVVKVESGSYILKCFNSDGTSTGITVNNTFSARFLDKDQNPAVQNVQRGVTITEEESSIIKYLRVNWSRSDYSGSSESIVAQLEHSLTATDYEPFGTTYPISWESEAGTVYGGTPDVVSGELTVDWAFADLGSLSWNYASGLFWAVVEGIKYPTTNAERAKGIICDRYSPDNTYIVSSASMADNTMLKYDAQGGTRLYIKNTAYTDTNTFKAAMTGAQLVYELDTPITYQLTPQEITTLLGQNNIWADTGDVTVTYGAYLETIKAHADRLGDSILSAIAPLEATYTASRAYAVGAFLFVGTKFYKVTAAIGSGDTINPGTNVTQTTVAAQLMELAGI